MSVRSLRRVAPFVAACGMIGPTACSLVYGLDGYATDGEAGTDAAADTVATDERDPARADAAGTDADSAAKFCEHVTPTTRLCDDFERDFLQGPWGKVREEGTGKATLASDKGGTYLHATLDATSVVSRACLERHVTMTIEKTVHWAFRIRIVASPKVSAQVMSLGVGSTSAIIASLGFTITPSSALMYEQNGDGTGYKSFALSRSLAPGIFHDVDVTVALATSPARIVAMIDGETAAIRDSQVGFAPGQDAFFQAGAAYALPAPDIAVDVDNVIIEAE